MFVGHAPVTRVSTVLALRRKQHIANLSCLCCFRRNPNTVETLVPGRVAILPESQIDMFIN